MRRKNSIESAPERIRSRTLEPRSTYERAHGYFAAHGSPSPRLRSAAVLLLQGGDLAICSGDPPGQGAEGEADLFGPVYRAPPGGSLVVPTGRIFLRFAERVPLEQRRRELEELGYEIESVTPHALHAGWLRPKSGSIVESLKGVQGLEALADVVNVEPQMLMRAAAR